MADDKAPEGPREARKQVREDVGAARKKARTERIMERGEKKVARLEGDAPSMIDRLRQRFQKGGKATTAPPSIQRLPYKPEYDPETGERIYPGAKLVPLSKSQRLLAEMEKRAGESNPKEKQGGE